MCDVAKRDQPSVSNGDFLLRGATLISDNRHLARLNSKAPLYYTIYYRQLLSQDVSNDALAQPCACAVTLAQSATGALLTDGAGEGVCGRRGGLCLQRPRASPGVGCRMAAPAEIKSYDRPNYQQQEWPMIFPVLDAYVRSVAVCSNRPIVAYYGQELRLAIRAVKDILFEAIQASRDRSRRTTAPNWNAAVRIYNQKIEFGNWTMNDWDRPDPFVELGSDPNEAFESIERHLELREHIYTHSFDLDDGFLANLPVPTDFWLRVGDGGMWHMIGTAWSDGYLRLTDKRYPHKEPYDGKNIKFWPRHASLIVPPEGHAKGGAISARHTLYIDDPISWQEVLQHWQAAHKCVMKQACVDQGGIPQIGGARTKEVESMDLLCEARQRLSPVAESGINGRRMWIDFFVHSLSCSRNLTFTVTFKYSLVALELMAICDIERDSEKVSTELPQGMQVADGMFMGIVQAAETEKLQRAKDMWVSFARKIHSEMAFKTPHAKLPTNSPLGKDASLSSGGVAGGSAAGDPRSSGGGDLSFDIKTTGTQPPRIPQGGASSVGDVSTTVPTTSGGGSFPSGIAAQPGVQAPPPPPPLSPFMILKPRIGGQLLDLSVEDLRLVNLVAHSPHCMSWRGFFYNYLRRVALEDHAELLPEYEKFNEMYQRNTRNWLLSMVAWLQQASVDWDLCCPVFTGDNFINCALRAMTDHSTSLFPDPLMIENDEDNNSKGTGTLELHLLGDSANCLYAYDREQTDYKLVGHLLREQLKMRVHECRSPGAKINSEPGSTKRKDKNFPRAPARYAYYEDHATPWLKGIIKQLEKGTIWYVNEAKRSARITVSALEISPPN